MATPNNPTNEPRSLSTAEAMRRLNYRSRQSFWIAVHSQSIPHCRINSRRIIFPEAALIAWIASRTAGVAP